jgi:hypothetical protein
MSTICRALLLLLGTTIVAFGQTTFTQCDINKDNVLNVIDAQDIINEGLGTRSPNDDLTGDGWVNAADIQVVIDGILGIGCLVTRTYSTTLFSVLNQAWIPTDIPSPGNLTVASSSQASVLNLAWISADIPSAGNLDFVAGMLVSVNNSATSGRPSLQRNPTIKVIAGGSSTAPVDLNSVNDGDGLIVGQTVRFRIYPPAGAVSNFDFLVNGEAMRIHAPFEVLITAPANVASFDIQAVMYAGDGRVWRLPGKHLLVLPDPGLTNRGPRRSRRWQPSGNCQGRGPNQRADCRVFSRGQWVCVLARSRSDAR